MNKRFDVVIVGGGVIGVAIACALAQEGRSVLLLEGAPSLGAGASYGNGGLVTPSHCLPLARPGVIRALPKMIVAGGAVRIHPRPSLVPFGLTLARAARQRRVLSTLRAIRDLARVSVHELEALLGTEGHRADYQRIGVMNVCRSTPAWDALLRDADLLRQEGFNPEVHHGDAARDVEPGLAGPLAGGVLFTEDAHCDPARLVDHLTQLARAAGAVIAVATPVLGVDADAHGERVRTASTSFTARHVVIAAGWRSAALLKRVGLRLPLQPARGYHVEIDGPPPIRTPLIFQELVIGATPLAERLRLAGTMEFGARQPPRDVRSRAERLLEDTRGSIRGLDRAASARHWAGERPFLPDGLPVVGPVPTRPTVIAATGHGMLGLTLAAVTARLVADIVAQRPSQVDRAQLAASRFMRTA